MTGKLWPLMLGFSIWALAFVALYALQALGCAWGWPEGPHRLVLIAVWLATLMLLAAALWWQRKGATGADATIRRAGLIGSAAALAATVLAYFPVTFATMCV